MTKVVDVRYRAAGKAYRFDANDLPLKRGDHVIVDNSKGKAYATVQNMPHDLIGEPLKPLRKVVRVATEEDEEKQRANVENEKKAYSFCKEKIAEMELDMKLVSAEQIFTGKKIIFYFTADERVDFRELVKVLAAEFHTRIEMRQIGVRDETTMCGGIGVCGRELCCCTFMTEFAPVSIKMAKAQNLSLNPGKISGVCGRLMCCLRNEAETYEELNKTVPKMGEKVGTPEGTEGVVTGLDVIRQRVKVLIIIDEDNKELHEYDASELKFKMRGGNKPAEKTKTENAEEEKPAQEQLKQEPKEEEPAQTQDEAEEEKPAKSPRERRRRRPNRRRRGNKKQGEKTAQQNNPAQE
ncbi:MAG: stage 0 sporulation protein [Lachnospiraceae bacterium]|nr:stage 0 sporulation protein [Lachnospiraceae bacterium]